MGGRHPVGLVPVQRIGGRKKHEKHKGHESMAARVFPVHPWPA
jgi:hypothetical protein